MFAHLDFAAGSDIFFAVIAVNRFVAVHVLGFHPKIHTGIDVRGFCAECLDLVWAILVFIFISLVRSLARPPS